MLVMAIAQGCGQDDTLVECRAGALALAAFHFHIVNRSSFPINFNFGCGGHPPIDLDTAEGPLGIGSESADVCGNDCQEVLDGIEPTSCTDCGPSLTQLVEPGATMDIEWDRRVWMRHVVSPSCSGLPKQHACALGLAIGEPSIRGRLTHCEVGSSFCTEPKTIPFVADLSRDEVFIEVR
jgi:hypothetical protein